MTPVVNGFSISAQRAGSYRQALAYLREELKRHGFEILSEFHVDSALERKVGLNSLHLGVPWKKCTVLVVWSPAEMCQALLSDHDGALLVPFNLCVAGDGNSTVAAVINPYGALIPRDGPIGIRLVIRNLTRRIYEVLETFGSLAASSQPGEVEVTEAAVSHVY